jgi:hypothetical protein
MNTCIHAPTQVQAARVTLPLDVLTAAELYELFSETADGDAREVALVLLDRFPMYLENRGVDDYDIPGVEPWLELITDRRLHDWVDDARIVSGVARCLVAASGTNLTALMFSQLLWALTSTLKRRSPQGRFLDALLREPGVFAPFMSHASGVIDEIRDLGSPLARWRDFLTQRFPSGLNAKP